MAKKFLLPVDFSDTSAKIITYAIDLAIKNGSRLVFCYVAKPDTDDTVDHSLFKDEIQVKIDDLRKKYSLNQLEIDDLEWGIVVLHGTSAGDEILKYAEEKEVELIIISTEGRTGFKRLFSSSVTEWIVRHSTIPVLTVNERFFETHKI